MFEHRIPHAVHAYGPRLDKRFSVVLPVRDAFVYEHIDGVHSMDTGRQS